MHEQWMRQCLELAAKAEKWVQPNPMVGAVITKDNIKISEGYHEEIGEAHAEVNAINNAGDIAFSECTIYVNLEPCAHHGKTPPCADLIIAKGFKRVVVGALDPNPLVAGKGIEKIKAAGIDLISGVLEDECLALNKKFYTFHQKKRPYITLKWAETADGFIGRHSSEDHLSHQISNEECRPFVHELRATHMAILIGANTANRDNPRLDLRFAEGRDPVKIIMSKRANVEPDLQLFSRGNTLVYNSLRGDKTELLEYVKLKHRNFIAQMMEDLHQRGISSVLIEGGSQVLQTFIDHRMFDEAYRIIAPLNWQRGVTAPIIDLGPTKEFKIADNSILHYQIV